MNEPTINIGILAAPQIDFDLYGDFTTAGVQKKLSGRFSAKIENDKIVVTKEDGNSISGKEIIITPDELETESFLLHNVVIGKSFHGKRKRTKDSAANSNSSSKEKTLPQ
jgi:hypothetical protein